jgi:acetyl-CoA synthetase
MARLTDFTSYADAQAQFSSAKLWELFDGNRERLNIAHECIDRHAGRANPAVIVVHADGSDEVLNFRDIAEDSSRFAHWLAAEGVGPGDRVALMLEPSRAFYMAIFGTMKRGAIAVPLFTLFGPDGVRLRVDDCAPRLIVTNAEKAPHLASAGPRVVVADATFFDDLARFEPGFAPSTAADALAIFQYTSGTTRELPEAVKHTHRAIVTLMVAALYGTGLRPGDRFICPSSPAWGHGLWHGTLAPLALGITVGSYAGKFDAERLLKALQQHQFTNISAAATHYRMMRNSGAASRYRYAIQKLSFTGEPIDSETAAVIAETFGRPACSM